MTALVEFLPLRDESILSIRARLDADVNAGLAPEDQSYIDTIEGGFYFDMTQPVALEIERLWDYLSTEVPAAAFITYAFGDYLDEHGVVLDVPRKAATPSYGEVTFAGANGTPIGTGVTVAVPNTDPDSDEEISFSTTEGGVISGGTLTLPVQADETGTAYNVAASTVTLVLSQVGDVTVTNAEAIRSGTDTEEDEPYRTRLLLELRSPGGQGNEADFLRWALGFPGIGFAKVNILWKGPGTVQVLVTDPDNNPVATVVRDALQAFLDPPTGQTQLNGAVNLNAATITVDSTNNFSTDGRFYVEVGGHFRAVTYTGKTGTTFTGCVGPNVAAPDNARVVQGGRAAGQVGPSAEVVVDTPSIVQIDVDADVTTRPGYSLDGDAGTIALRPAIEESLRNYINSLPPGEDVRLNRVESQFFRVEGIYDVANVTLNGSGANVTIGNDPPQVAETDDLSAISWAGAVATP